LEACSLFATLLQHANAVLELAKIPINKKNNMVIVLDILSKLDNYSGSNNSAPYTSIHPNSPRCGAKPGTNLARTHPNQKGFMHFTA
jgi:hypothetical protein